LFRRAAPAARLNASFPATALTILSVQPSKLQPRPKSGSQGSEPPQRAGFEMTRLLKTAWFFTVFVQN
jgi:hypothetical protein